MSTPAHAQPGRRNRIIALALGILFGLILLVVLLTQCSPTDTGPPTGTAPTSASSGPPVVVDPSDTSASPDPDPSTSPSTEPSASPDDTDGDGNGNGDGDGDGDGDGGSTTTAPTPKGGVDAGGGSGTLDRRVPFLTIGAFLLIGATVAGWVAIGRRSRA